MRDLVRTREDAVAMQRQARHRLAALLLHNEIRYAGRTAWTAAHRRWIARLTLPRPAQRIAFPHGTVGRKSYAEYHDASPTPNAAILGIVRNSS